MELAAGAGRRVPDARCAYRSRLSPMEQAIYDQMVSAMCELRTNVTIFGRRLEAYRGVFEAVKWDQPLLYYVAFDKELCHVGTNRWTRLTWKMNVPPVHVAAYDEQIACALQALAPRSGVSMLEAEVQIHDKLLAWGMRPVRGSAGSWEDHCIVGPLLRGHTVCEGMAQAFSLLCQQNGIPCMLAVGWGKKELHAWNMVQLGGGWKHVDAYWDLCLSEYRLHRDYLNCSDEEMRTDHSWDEQLYPACPQWGRQVG